MTNEIASSLNRETVSARNSLNRSTYNERLCHDILHLSTIPTAFAWLRKSFEDNEYSSEELRNEIRESSCRIPQSYILLSSRERWLGTILEYD